MGAALEQAAKELKEKEVIIPQITEDRVRQIVREEIQAAKTPRQRPFGLKPPTQKA